MFSIEDLKQIVKAQLMATKAHGSQKRKYSGLPYIIHPTAVARNVLDHIHLFPEMNVRDLVIAAYLHDTLEDTPLTKEEIIDEFGLNVFNLVAAVTSDKDEMVKYESKGHYLVEKMKKMKPDALFLKLMDRLDNIRSCYHEIIAYDDSNEFVKKYLSETLFIVSKMMVHVDMSTYLPAEFHQIIKLIERWCIDIAEEMYVKTRQRK